MVGRLLPHSTPKHVAIRVSIANVASVVSHDPWERGWKVILNVKPHSVQLTDDKEDMLLAQSTNKYGVDLHIHNDGLETRDAG